MQDLIRIVFVLLLLSACTTAAPMFDALPEGNIERGAALFTEAMNGTPSCASCHTINGDALTGPSLLGYGAAATTRIADVSASEYTFTSIVLPAQYIVPGFSNSMYNQYAAKLTPQQIADLIAYLLSL